MPAWSGTSDSRLGRTAWSSLKTSQPTATVVRPISVMLVPSAVIPPSANNRDWTAKTTLRHRIAVHGPTRTAASAPPIRWPLVPTPTGKVIICAAKMKAATSPTMGAVLSSSSLRALTSAVPTQTAATAPVATEVGASRKPSGTCMRSPAQWRLTGDRLGGTRDCSAYVIAHRLRHGVCHVSQPARLSPGDTAPEFTLTDDAGKEVALSDFLGRKVIVYFYPAAMTPGCTKQACDFTDSLDSLQAQGYEVVGISPDKPEKLAKFRERDGLTITLLSDPDKLVMKEYAAFGEKKLYGKVVEGVIRSTVVVDEDGKVFLAQYNVKATGHVAKLRRDLELNLADEEPR